jgi:bisphosphoglycerate-dependent phosphoglycerate mutase
MKKEHINVLIICHGNSIRPMIRFFEHLSVEKMLKFEYARHKIFHYQMTAKGGED